MKVQLTRTIKRIVKLKYEDGILKVLAFWKLPVKRIKQIIQDNIEWINSQKKMIATPLETNVKQAIPCPNVTSLPDDSAQTIPGNLVSEMFAGRKTLVMGDVITICESASSKTYLDGNILYLSCKYYNLRESRLKAIKSFLKKLATLYVADEIANFGSDISLCPAKIEFRENGDFWVKCSLASQRILCFDFRIVQLPHNLRRYVIAHAFAHFSHPIHDDGFWDFLSDTIPKYREYSNELKNYQILKEVG